MRRTWPQMSILQSYVGIVGPTAPSIFGLVQQTLDSGTNVARRVGLGKPAIEHELRDARGGGNLGLQNVGLAREQHLLRAKSRADLFGDRLSRDDETVVGDPARLRCVGC